MVTDAAESKVWIERRGDGKVVGISTLPINNARAGHAVELDEAIEDAMKGESQ